MLQKGPYESVEDLEISTITVMCHTNCEFDQKVLFDNLPVAKIDGSMAAKKNNKYIDKKKLNPPKGAIVSLRTMRALRGLDCRKKTKKWCPKCELDPIVTKSGKEKPQNTLDEKIRKDEDDEELYWIFYRCSKCGNEFTVDELTKGKIPTFLNQLSVLLSLGNGIHLDIMIFNTNYKIAGCIKEDHAAEASLILFEDYFQHIDGAYSLWKEKTPRIIFEPVMMNMGVGMDFPVFRDNLRLLLTQDTRYKDKIFTVRYESTGGSNNVSIKFNFDRPEDYMHDRLTIPSGSTRSSRTHEAAFFDRVESTEMYRKTPAKAPKPPTATVFSTSQIILSAKYRSVLKDMHDLLIRVFEENRDDIEEILKRPDPKKIAAIAKFF